MDDLKGKKFYWNEINKDMKTLKKDRGLESLNAFKIAVKAYTSEYGYSKIG